MGKCRRQNHRCLQKYGKLNHLSIGEEQLQLIEMIEIF